jgi:hypothetical protein
MRQFFSVALLGCAPIAWSLGCSDSHGGGGGDGEQGAKCQEMCQHLVDDLGGCGKSVTVETCVPECEEHVDSNESNADDVACGKEAATCEVWKDCGDLL